MLVSGLGREPTTEEIAEVTGIEPDEVDSIRRLAQAPISLEMPVGERSSPSWQFIADERRNSLRARRGDPHQRGPAQGAREPRLPRAARAQLRYGLGGEHPRTLDEVGRTFNVTRERIRQIENQSLKKLQKLYEAEKLQDDVEIASGFPLRTLGHRA